MKRLILAASALALVAALFSMGSAQAACQDITIGQVCADGDPTTQTGEVYADGIDGNPDPLDGYLGLNSDQGVVGCASGDYDADRATDNDETDDNNVISPIPPEGAPAPPGEGPCTPTGPAAP